MSDLRARFRVHGARTALSAWLRLTAPARRLVDSIRKIDDLLSALTQLGPGTRVRLTGKCCTVGVKHKGEMATITEARHDLEDPDYNIRVAGKVYRWSDGTLQENGHDYACERGFDVVEYR